MLEQEVKLDLIQWIANTNDMVSIKKIKSIRDKSFQLTPDQEAILENRMAKYEHGLMKFSSWEDVRNRIIKKQRDGIYKAIDANIEGYWGILVDDGRTLNCSKYFYETVARYRHRQVDEILSD